MSETVSFLEELGALWASEYGYSSFSESPYVKGVLTCASSVKMSALWYASYSLMRKCPVLGEEESKRLKAVRSFQDSELRCKQTNNRLRFDRLPLSAECESVLHTARRKIERILGDFDYAEHSQSCYHGPGVTTSIRGDRLGVDVKLSEGQPSCSRRAARLSGNYWMRLSGHISKDGSLSYDDGPSSPLLKFEDCDEITFVSKTRSTHRSISITPSTNIVLQLGIGVMIERKLRRAGFDISRLEGQHREFARYSSIMQTHATVDLSSASDSICTELVRLLIPPEWFEFLDTIRMQRYTLDGQLYEYEKFSGMGNGFTFPLETLIFLTLAQSVTELNGVSSFAVSCYGDDIIIPCSCYASFLRVMTELGFLTNEEKTFVDGGFRESCGGHYLHGCDITPMYIRTESRSLKPWDACIVRNRYIAWCQRLADCGYLVYSCTIDRFLIEAAEKCSRTAVPIVPPFVDDSCGIKVPNWPLDANGIARFTGYSFQPDKYPSLDAAVYASRWLGLTVSGDQPYRGCLPYRKRGRWIKIPQRRYPFK